MEIVKIVIERTDDLFSGYAENVEGVYVGGESVEETKKSVEDAIRLLKEYNTSENIPDILKNEYEIEYSYDIQSFFDYYKRLFNNPALEKLTGINQKQLHHYATGHRKPRTESIKKLEDALHKLGAELSSVKLSH